jgi:hypothetical protein
MSADRSNPIETYGEKHEARERAMAGKEKKEKFQEKSQELTEAQVDKYAADKRADDAEKEVESLKRKRASSASPPPPITLMVMSVLGRKLHLPLPLHLLEQNFFLPHHDPLPRSPGARSTDGTIQLPLWAT